MEKTFLEITCFMNKHDVERAKARKAQKVGAARSQKKAAMKRALTITAKAAVGTGVTIAGVKYAQSKGVNINVSDVAKVARYKNYMTMAMRYMY